ncbi:hypothetical protein Tco_0339558 [Tanacetum coccineum]
MAFRFIQTLISQASTSKTTGTANVSKSFSIPDEESSNDTPSFAQKFLKEVKDTLVTLQRVVKHRMNGNITNLSSLTHQEIYKIFKDEIVPIVNQVDVREADDSLDKIKVLEIKNKHLLRAVVSQDIMSIVQNDSVVDTFDLHIELDHMKEKLESCIIKKEKEYATLWNDCQCLITANRDVCMLNYVNDMNSRDNKLSVNVSNIENQKKHKPKVKKPKKVGSKERLVSPTPSEPSICRSNLKLLINFSWKFLGTVRFGNDHIAAIMGYDDL